MFRDIKGVITLCACVIALVACGSPAPTEPPPTITPVLVPTVIPLPTADATALAISTAAAKAALESPLASPNDAMQSPIAAPPGADFAPAKRSVWNTSIVGQDQMQGNCVKGSVLPAYGLVQITPFEGGFEWKNQEPKPYEMTRIGENEYQFAGPNSINDGVVTMTVKFVDDKNLTMRREYVASNDAGCTHVHDYTGVFQWYR